MGGKQTFPVHERQTNVTIPAPDDNWLGIAAGQVNEVEFSALFDAEIERRNVRWQDYIRIIRIDHRSWRDEGDIAGYFGLVARQYERTQYE